MPGRMLDLNDSESSEDEDVRDDITQPAVPVANVPSSNGAGPQESMPPLNTMVVRAPVLRSASLRAATPRPAAPDVSSKSVIKRVAKRGAKRTARPSFANHEPKFLPIPALPERSMQVPTVVGMVPDGGSILIIKEPWINLILDGRKSLEIRGQSTKKAMQRVFLALSGGGGLVLGSALLVCCHGPLSRREWAELKNNHCVAGDKLPYASTYAWELCSPQRFDVPVSYEHKQGCVVWATA
jgi:hypothetical protein